MYEEREIQKRGFLLGRSGFVNLWPESTSGSCRHRAGREIQRRMTTKEESLPQEHLPLRLVTLIHLVIGKEDDRDRRKPCSSVVWLGESLFRREKDDRDGRSFKREKQRESMLFVAVWAGHAKTFHFGSITGRALSLSHYIWHD
eukprot:TRINITY_DN12181_c0_g2_i2.p2 TRINITY_DN12181_c0_g2~~TRINITY_DN12181_c0_g2_i2.p2  ORF type:complete len:144 (+),score=17.51 TRINITY_DN12181_c0_g2_i2:255-686(+)